MNTPTPITPAWIHGLSSLLVVPVSGVFFILIGVVVIIGTPILVLLMYLKRRKEIILNETRPGQPSPT
jgi:hypothetical protein